MNDRWSDSERNAKTVQFAWSILAGIGLMSVMIAALPASDTLRPPQTERASVEVRQTSIPESQRDWEHGERPDFAKRPEPRWPMMTRYTPEEKAAAQQRAEERRVSDASRRNAESAAQVSCQFAAMAHAKYPSKADLYWLGQSVVSQPDGTIVIGGKVDFQNGFGAMIPHVYRCTADAQGQLTSITVREE